jgi:NADPH-dependent curcumin reductase CurA
VSIASINKSDQPLKSTRSGIILTLPFLKMPQNPISSREVHLVSRPEGLPVPANFSLVKTVLPPLLENQVLVRNHFVSVDPYMRGRMNDRESYVPAFKLGDPMDGGAVGEVIDSRASSFQQGDVVTSNFGWREAFIAGPEDLHPVSHEVPSLSVYLGALGMTGMTAWAGLNLVDVKAGDVIYISGAAGAVGNVAGQLAGLRRCRVIGSAGSAEKVKFLLDECGFDAAFNYKTGPVLDQLKAAAPDGIDVYFDNVGGESLEAALSHLRLNGRIIACGGISGYNAEKPRPGPANLFNITGKRLTMKGLMVRDWMARQKDFETEAGGYFRSGKLINKETVVEGLEHAAEAFIGLFEGSNIGKMVVKTV